MKNARIFALKHKLSFAVQIKYGESPLLRDIYIHISYNAMPSLAPNIIAIVYHRNPQAVKYAEDIGGSKSYYSTIFWMAEQ